LSDIFVNIFNKRGQSLVLLAISAVVFLLLAGVVLDAGNIFWQYRQLRNYSDAAALAGAVELPQAAAARDSAAEYYSQNIAKGLKAVDAENNTIMYIGNGEDTLYVTSPFRDDRTFRLGVPSNWTIEVRAERIAKTFWLRLIGIRDIPIRARSVAKGGGGWNTSILASSKTGTQGGGYSLELSGSSNHFDRPASTNHNFKVTGSGNTGTVEYSGIIDNNHVSVNNKIASRYIDPLIPPVYDMMAYQGSATFKYVGDYTFPPDARLEGIYFIDGNVKLQSRISGKATIVATGDIKIVGNNIKLVPYDDGPMLFFAGNILEISGRGHTLNGVFYAPNGLLDMAAAYSNIYGGMVADIISFSASNVTLSYEIRYFPGEVKLIE